MISLCVSVMFMFCLVVCSSILVLLKLVMMIGVIGRLVCVNYWC